MVKSNPRLETRARRRIARLKRTQQTHQQNEPQLTSPVSSPKPTPEPTTTPAPQTTQSLPGQGSILISELPICSDLMPSSRILMGQLPPLPPPPSKHLLRRTVSEPVPLGSVTPNSLTKSPSNARNFPCYSPPLSSSTYKRLRRVNNHGNINAFTCCSRIDDGDKGKVKEKRIGAERLEGDWIMIKINCSCGSGYQFLVSEAEKKCYYKLV